MRCEFYEYMASLNDESLFEAFDEAEEFRNTGILKGPDGRVRGIRAAWEAAFGSKLDVKSITEELYYEVNYPAQAMVWVGPVRRGQSEKAASC